MFRQLWRDENGAVVTAELVLVLSILVIGALTGLVSLRDAIVTELADVAEAIAVLDQSYLIPGVTTVYSATAGTEYIDIRDRGDDAVATGTPRGIIVAATAPRNESSVDRRIR